MSVNFLFVVLTATVATEVEHLEAQLLRLEERLAVEVAALAGTHEQLQRLQGDECEPGDDCVSLEEFLEAGQHEAGLEEYESQRATLLLKATQDACEEGKAAKYPTMHKIWGYFSGADDPRSEFATWMFPATYEVTSNLKCCDCLKAKARKRSTSSFKTIRTISNFFAVVNMQATCGVCGPQFDKLTCWEHLYENFWEYHPTAGWNQMVSHLGCDTQLLVNQCAEHFKVCNPTANPLCNPKKGEITLQDTCKYLR